jgi:hypothetical protein
LMVGRNQCDEDWRDGVIDVSVASQAGSDTVGSRSDCGADTGSLCSTEATGVRDGIVEEEAAGEVSLIDAMSIMVRPMSLAVRECAGHARRSR